jgi:hypothetical protein
MLMFVTTLVLGVITMPRRPIEIVLGHPVALSRSFFDLGHCAVLTSVFSVGWSSRIKPRSTP